MDTFTCLRSQMILMFRKRINKNGKIAEKGIRKYVLKKIHNVSIYVYT